MSARCEVNNAVSSARFAVALKAVHVLRTDQFWKQYRPENGTLPYFPKPFALFS